jgi:arylsulfatase A-like enzyme
MTDRLNVLVAVIGCARADHCSAYGYERETTPFLEQAAREGVRVRYMVSTSPATLPANASLLTGLFPSQHGATEEAPFLDPRRQVLPALLKDAGYKTAAFCPNPWVSPETGCGRGFDSFHTQRVGGRVAGRAALYARTASDRVLGRTDAGARRTNRALLAWLERVEEPFFAFAYYGEADLPLRPPAPYDRMFMPTGIAPAQVRSVHHDSAAVAAGERPATAEDARVLNALYDGALRYVDLRLQELAAALARQGRWERTLFLVLGDHGSYLGEHGRVGHLFGLHDTVLCTPFILRGPQAVPAGFVVDELVQPTDVLPTILALAGAAALDGLPGRPIIRDGQVSAGPAFAIAEGFRPNLSALRRRFPKLDEERLAVRRKAIRTRREKFIWRSDEANELYDLTRDPGEEHNLIERAADRAETLRQALFDWLASTERAEHEHEQTPSAVTRRQLQRLGELE